MAEWTALGGDVRGTPEAARNADGRMEVFIRAKNGTVVDRWQDEPNGGWTDWSSLGGIVHSDVRALAHENGRLELFAVGTDGALWDLYQTAPSAGWREERVNNPPEPSASDDPFDQFDAALVSGQSTRFDWHSFGGNWAERPAGAVDAEGRMQVLAVGSAGDLRTMGQTARGEGWTDWTTFERAFQPQPAAARNRDGRVEGFIRATDGSLRHASLAADGTWSAWEPLSDVRLASSPSVAAGQDGRLELFATTAEGTIWHAWQTGPTTWNEWSGPAPIAPGAQPVAVLNENGRLHVFARGADGSLHGWPQAEPNGPWGEWASYGRLSPAASVDSDPAACLDGSGWARAFVRGSDNGLWLL